MFFRFDFLLLPLPFCLNALEKKEIAMNSLVDFMDALQFVFIFTRSTLSLSLFRCLPLNHPRVSALNHHPMMQIT